MGNMTTQSMVSLNVVPVHIREIINHVSNT
jgi:hypothetical protein